MVAVLSLDNKETGKVEVPKQFKSKVNPDLIMRAFLSEQSKTFQLKYTDPMAGKRKSAELKKTRRTYRTAYRGDTTRTPKKIVWRIGSRFNYIGAVVPNTVGGREAHPPKADKVLVKEMNEKERHAAVMSAIAGSADEQLVRRFHSMGSLKNLPLVVEDALNKIETTSEAEKTLTVLGLGEELGRIKNRRLRAGHGKMRGRRYKRRLGPLIITTDDSKISRAVRNLNINVKRVNSLTVSDVSHAGNPGRLLLWTKSAISALEK